MSHADLADRRMKTIFDQRARRSFGYLKRVRPGAKRVEDSSPLVVLLIWLPWRAYEVKPKQDYFNPQE